MKIECYEIVFNESQLTVNKNVTPLEINNLQHNWRELQGYIKIYENRLYQKKFTGLFSPKFQKKCNISINDLKNFIGNNKGFDVYFINPSPQVSYWSYNVWMQGEKAHPGIIKIAEGLCKKVGINLPIDVSTQRHGLKEAAYSNFWIANEYFWEKYVGKVLMPIVHYLRNNIDSKIWRLVHNPTNHTQKSVILPFIIERLFSTFIYDNSEIKSLSFNYKENYIKQLLLNDFESELLACSKLLCNLTENNSINKSTIIEIMWHLTGLYQQHFWDYYSKRIHPHSSEKVNKIDYV